MTKPKIKYPRRCATPRCHGVVASRSHHSDKCPKCRWRIYVAKNPLGAAFKHLRNHAKERGKDFSLTFEQFKVFAEKTDYLRMKGKTSLSLSIDRVNNSEGYHWWNVQTLTLRENTRKQYVPFFAKQMENNNYEPTAEEIAEAEKAMTESNL